MIQCGFRLIAKFTYYSSAVFQCDGRERRFISFMKIGSFILVNWKGELHPAENLVYLKGLLSFPAWIFRHTHKDVIVSRSCLRLILWTEALLPAHSALLVSPPLWARRCWLLCCRVGCEKLPSGLLVMLKALNKAVLLSSGRTLSSSQDSELRAGLVLCCGCWLFDHTIEREPSGSCRLRIKYQYILINHLMLIHCCKRTRVNPFKEVVLLIFA